MERLLRSRRRGGYAMLITMILIAILTIIGATSLSVAGVDHRIAIHNRRHMMVVNTADAGTEHARFQLQSENPRDEGWDTADTGNLFVPANEGDLLFEGLTFPMSQGVYAVDATFVKCSNPPPGYSTDEKSTSFRSDFWDMSSHAEFTDTSYQQVNPTQATVVATLRKVVQGPCKIR